MNLKSISEEILPYLEEPKTVYQLCADKEQGYASIHQKMKILEAAGIVKKIRSGRGVLWRKTEQPA